MSDANPGELTEAQRAMLANVPLQVANPLGIIGGMQQSGNPLSVGAGVQSQVHAGSGAAAITPAQQLARLLQAVWPGVGGGVTIEEVVRKAVEQRQGLEFANRELAVVVKSITGGSLNSKLAQEKAQRWREKELRGETVEQVISPEIMELAELLGVPPEGTNADLVAGARKLVAAAQVPGTRNQVMQFTETLGKMAEKLGLPPESDEAGILVGLQRLLDHVVSQNKLIAANETLSERFSQLGAERNELANQNDSMGSRLLALEREKEFLADTITKLKTGSEESAALIRDLEARREQLEAELAKQTAARSEDSDLIRSASDEIDSLKAEIAELKKKPKK